MDIKQEVLLWQSPSCAWDWNRMQTRVLKGTRMPAGGLRGVKTWTGSTWQHQERESLMMSQEDSGQHQDLNSGTWQVSKCQPGKWFTPGKVFLLCFHRTTRDHKSQNQWVPWRHNACCRDFSLQLVLEVEKTKLTSSGDISYLPHHRPCGDRVNHAPRSVLQKASLTIVLCLQTMSDGWHGLLQGEPFWIPALPF